MSFGLPKKRRPLLLRQIIGRSMQPRLQDGQVVVASGWYRQLAPRDVVIINHDGMEKIKRIDRIVDNRIFVLGDNTEASTDSRDFGWVETAHVLGKVLWPRLEVR